MFKALILFIIRLIMLPIVVVISAAAAVLIITAFAIEWVITGDNNDEMLHMR